MGYPKALFFTYPDNPSNTKSMATLLAVLVGGGVALASPQQFPIDEAKDARRQPPNDKPL